MISGEGGDVVQVEERYLGEANFDPGKRFRRMGIPDVFPDQYGTQDSLMERYSLTSEETSSPSKNYWKAASFPPWMRVESKRPFDLVRRYQLQPTPTQD